MKYDESKVYTALNADELKGGVKVIVADTLERLKSRVRENDVSKCSGRLLSVWPEDYEYRFQFEDENKYALAYLVEEPEGLKWTDLKVGDLKIGDVITNGKITAMVTVIVSSTFTTSHIYAGNKWLSDDELEEWEKVEND